MEHKNYNEEVIHQVIDVAQRYAQAVAEELQATYDPELGSQARCYCSNRTQLGNRPLT